MMNPPIPKTRRRRGGIPLATKTPIPPPPTAAATKSRRTIRIIFTDADATDSSSSDEDHPIRLHPPKKLIYEIAIDASLISPRRKPHHHHHPPQHKKFRGVRQRPWGRFSAEIRNPFQRKRLWLGTFDTPEEAAAVYDFAAFQLKGEKAVTNFPIGKICRNESEASETPLRASAPLPSPTSVLLFDQNEPPFGEWIGYGDVDAFGFSVVETPLCLSESLVQRKPAPIWEEIEFEELDDLSLLEDDDDAALPSFG